MITQYELINPVTDKNSPFYNQKKGLFYFKSKTNYKWYLECSRFNENVQDIEFYVLLSENKFDINCKKCHIDNYGRCQFRPTGKIKDFILEECEYRGNFIFEYLETENNYDFYKLE